MVYVCGTCFRANEATLPGQYSMADFDARDTHAKLATHRNGIVKCSPQKATACSVKVVMPNPRYTDSIVGDPLQPSSCVYQLPHKAPKDKAALLACVDTQEPVRLHLLFPHTQVWIFCGYYTVHTPNERSVVLKLVAHDPSEQELSQCERVLYKEAN